MKIEFVAVILCSIAFFVGALVLPPDPIGELAKFVLTLGH